MPGHWPFTAEKIAARLSLIAPYVHRRSEPLPNLRLLSLAEALIHAPISDDPADWQEIHHNSYWGHADLNFVMKCDFKVPEAWTADNLALHFPLGGLGDIFNHPEALVHVDQRVIGSADRYHHRLPLDASFADGQSHTVALHGWTGLAGWPPDAKSKTQLFMGQPAVVQVDAALQEFVWLATAALDAANKLGPESATNHSLLTALDEAFKVLDTRDPIGAALYDSVPAAMSVLQDGLVTVQPLDRFNLHGIGHSHMDIAYLWPIDQIRLKNARTYSNVLRLMEENPDFRFSHSQPQLYAMVEQDYPAIFEQIKARVSEGKWEVMGGMWVEPDLNIPGPEALVQQLILGRAYFQDRFGGVETPVLWLPDTFGFPAQTPQLMRHAGLKWFVTNKLNWNQKNKVPFSTHQWEGLDGSRAIAHILTTPRDVQYLPFPTNYKSDLSAAEVHGTCADATIPQQIDDLLICYGYGDGGGGPTDELIAKARAFSSMPGMPRFRMSTVQAAFEKIEEVADELPVWRGEHYMEGHRGVLTSQAWIKRANRKAEVALHEAEALSVMAGLAPDLSEAWRLLCLNQFHDIISGTAVEQVFRDARRDFTELRRLAETASLAAAEALSGDEEAVANTSPVGGPRVIEDTKGALHYFSDLPAYSVNPISKATAPKTPVQVSHSGATATLENEHLIVEIDGEGQLSRVFDRVLDREVLRKGAKGNVLQAFEDRPICWDAWDIDPFFEDRTEIVRGKTRMEVSEDDPLRASVRVERQWRDSRIMQTIRLSAGSRRIDVETIADWHESHTLLKAAFPTGISADRAEFDIQWGHVERSTRRESSFDQARFEVPAQKWARLKDNTRSLAVLNDCKYGYDVRYDVIRITLIKSSTAPDPQADQGEHRFTYSLLPGVADSRDDLDAEAYALNIPTRWISARNNARPVPEPFVKSLSINVILETLKPARAENTFILRTFEAHGRATKAKLQFAEDLKSVEVVTFDETPIEALLPQRTHVAFDVKPFEIITLRVAFVGTTQEAISAFA